MTEPMSTLTTYLVAMRDARGRTLVEDHGEAGSEHDERKAKRRYQQHVRTFNSAGFSEEVSEIVLIRLDDNRRRSTLRSTKPQTSRAKAQLAMGVGE